MSYRYTNTDKWSDAWFSNLKQIEMLLFVYLCDNCDIAGFIEVNYKRWASDLNSSIETIEGALKGLQRGLVWSNDMDCVFLRNYLKHQKNMPLNENNKAHLGILRRFENYKHKFDIQDINEFLEGASKGLQSPTGIGNGIGNGIGIGNGNGKKPPKIEKKFIAPEIDHVVEYFKQNGYPVELAYKFFKGYSEADWKDSNGKQVLNWKQKAQMIWFNEKNKIVYQHQMPVPR